MYTLQLILAFLAGNFVSAPNTGVGPNEEVLSCYADAAHTALLKQDQEYAKRMDSLDQAWSAVAQSGGMEEKSVAPPPFVLPIVFHIVHENGPENISDADVQRSVDFLNQALANTDYYDPTTGVNTQIQVCLAQRTPDNQPTNGITRTVSPLTNLDAADDIQLKDLSRWAPRDYINVWAVKEVSGLGLGRGLAGYAYYPGAHGGRVDGIVLEARWLARDEAAAGVLIHELGHYLGLYHTFNGGCGNDDCTRNGDRVCDTPPDQSTVAVPCDGSANSCDTDTNSGFTTDQDDMHINYMDYGYFRCYSAFTAGQRDRMHFFLDGIRRSLTESKGCLTPCPGLVTAGFTGGDVTIPVGTTINFVNTSTNGASFRWVRGQVLLSTATNYSQTFNTTGTYRIKLVANPSDLGICLADSVEQVIRVICPVMADFTFPSANYETGATITFVNASTDGGNSTWSVNGTQVGTDPDLTNTFTAPGRYQVCLRESNGLCSEQRCQSLIVSAPPCDVNAVFIYNSDGFSVGGTLNFTNLSTGGTTRSWTIDGTQVSMASNHSQVFPDLGSFEVCLRESNGICEREFCRVVEVPEEPCTGPDCPGNEGCAGSFTYLYGLPDGGLPEEVTAVLPDGDRFFLSLSDGNRIWVISVREDGSVLWQTEVFPLGNVGLITEMMLDDEGQLAAIGRTSLNRDDGDHSFMVRINASTGDLLWGRDYQSEGIRPIFNRVFSQRNTGNYAIIGYTENTNATVTAFDRDGLFLTIDKADGSIANGPLHYENNGVLRFNSADYDRDIDQYYVLGNIDGGATPGSLGNGPFMVVLDGAGTPITNQLYNLGQVANSFPVGIVKEGDDLVIALTAEENSPPSHNAYLLRTNLSGEIKIATKLPGLSGPATEMRAHNQRYTLSGEHLITIAPFQTDLIQLDVNGTVNWATSIIDHTQPSTLRYPATPQMINTHNNQLVLAGSDHSLQEGAILKLDQFGRPDTECHDIVPGQVTSEELELQTNVLQFFAEPSQYFTTDFFSEPGGMVFNSESCALDCPGIDTVDCREPFFLQFTENDAVDMTMFTAVVQRGNIYYVGGESNGRTYIAAITPQGEMLWQLFGTFAGTTAHVNSLDFDSEGNLIGTALYNLVAPIVFRLNAQNGEIIWSKTLTNASEIYQITDIHERGPGGNFIITGTGPDQESMTILLDRESGNILRTQLSYPPAASFGYVASGYNEATRTLYALSNVRTGSGLKPILSAINDNDSLLWAKELFPEQGNIDVTGLQVMVSEDQLIIGARTVPDADDNSLGLVVRLNWDGIPINGQISSGGSGYQLQRLGLVQGRYVLLFQSANTQSQVLYFHNISNDLRRREQVNRSSVPTYAPNLTVTDNYVIISGQRAPSMSPVLEYVGIEGGRAEGCDESTFALNASTLFTSNNQQNDLGLSGPGVPIGSPLSANDGGLNPRNNFGLTFDPNSSCLPDCSPQEICDNQIDDDEDGLIDCDDPDIENDCCCLAQPIINLGPDTTLCPGDLLSEGTDRRFVTYQWSTGATTDSIAIAEAGDYWLMVTDSCGNLATDTLTVHLRPRPLLDLGPDTTLCSNAIIPLLAQDGFASYEWVDGTTEKEFTGFGEGQFWVVATDSCGGVQTDTVNVRIDPATEINLGADTLICPGDTLTFQLAGFNDYQWSVSTFIDCTNCPVVRFAPTTDTLLLVAAEFGGGCFSSDSIRVGILPVIGNRDSVYLCPGDSVVFGDTTLFTSGQYLDIRQNNECQVIDTLDIFQLRDTLTSESFSICPGDSLLVFDRFERLAGTYERSYAAGNGCDSTHTIRLVVRPTVITSTTISICAGDSSLIFGSFEQTPGEYSRVFTGTNQCDSTHVITLEVNALEVSAAQLQPVCGAAAGAGEVLFNQPAEAVSIRWPDGTDQARNSDLAAGDYAITVTTLLEGCSAIANLTIEEGRDLSLLASVTPETCPGENDGTITVSTSALNGLSFSLDEGTVVSTPMFTNLSPSDYTLLVIDSLGCDQEFLLTVEPAGPVLLDLPETMTIALGDSVTLEPQTNLPTGAYVINWRTTLGDTCANCSILTLRPPSNTTVFATLTDTSGCTTTDQTMITVNQENLFYVPNAFSPNGDGVNDVFRLYPGPGVDRLLRFSVYDRWGGQVYHTEDLSPTDALAAWDGRSPNGQLPSIGVYVYLIEVKLSNGEVISQAGEVLLMR